MTNEEMNKRSKEIFGQIAERLDARKIRYEKGTHSNGYCFHFFFKGEDLPMEFNLLVDSGRQLLRLISILPFTFQSGKTEEAALAVCAVNGTMKRGCFVFDPESGGVTFRINNTFLECLLDMDVLDGLLREALIAVDKYNDRFFKLNAGLMSVEEVIQ